MNPELVDIPASTHITGLSVRTSNARERDPATAALPSLWSRFTAAQAKQVRGDLPASPVYSVYTEYESDVNGAYTVVLGREDVFPDPPESAERTVIVPARRYLVFSSTGEMPDAVLNGWQHVWTYFSRPDVPKRAFTTDFEYYNPAQPSTVRIYIAVRDCDTDPGT